MKILITGATGYVGSQLVKQLIEQREEINILVRDIYSIHIPAGKNINVFKGDITDQESISKAIKGCKQVYHCAAVAKFSMADRNILFSTNVNGTRNILEASLKTNIQKLVFTSSAAVFGPSLTTPLTETDSRIEAFESDYDISKHQAEKLVHEFVAKGLNAVIVNPSRVYGPGPATYSNAVNRMIQKFLDKKMLLFPNIGKYISNYCYIDDVVNGHLLAMQKAKAGENYILGGENISYDKLINSIIKYADLKNYILKVPVSFAKKFASLSVFLNKDSELTPSLITRFAKHRMLKCEKAIKELGYHITTFDEGIKTTIDYLKNKSIKTKTIQTKFYEYGKDKVSARTH